MPYDIVVLKKKGKYNVVKRDTREVVATHDSRTKAAKQIRAIYLNEMKKRGHPSY